jgi:hypothetical protein
MYSCRRGLSNRPARGTFIACSESGDCGAQVQREACRCLVAAGGVWPRGIVIVDLGRNQISGMDEVAIQRLVQKLVPHSAVGACDKAILRWLSRCDVVPF